MRKRNIFRGEGGEKSERKLLWQIFIGATLPINSGRKYLWGAFGGKE